HPLTLDEKGLAREKAIAMKRLVAARLAYRVRLAQAKLDSEVSARGKTKVADEKDVLSEQDRFGLHIEIMAVRRNLPVLQSQILRIVQTVRAYYQIAASRFADNICLGIQSRLFASCGRAMED